MQANHGITKVIAFAMHRRSHERHVKLDDLCDVRRMQNIARPFRDAEVIEQSRCIARYPCEPIWARLDLYVPGTGEQATRRQNFTVFSQRYVYRSAADVEIEYRPVGIFAR